jgi:hypothetical protein
LTKSCDCCLLLAGYLLFLLVDLLRHQWTTWHHISQNSIHHNFLLEIFKLHILPFLLKSLGYTFYQYCVVCKLNTNLSWLSCIKIWSSVNSFIYIHTSTALVLFWFLSWSCPFSHEVKLSTQTNETPALSYTLIVFTVYQMFSMSSHLHNFQ